MSIERSRYFPVVNLALCLVAALGSLGRAADEPAREWSTKTGAARTTAKFLRQESGRVVLQRADGVAVEIPLDRLSLADQAYIAARAEEAHLALPPLPTPNAADAQVVVSYSFENFENQLVVATVFHEDDRFRYLATEPMRNTFYRMLSAIQVTDVPFTAIVGDEAAPRRVALEKVSFTGGRLILAAPKQELPPPLVIASTPVAPQRGDRLRFVGYELRGSNRGMDFARVTSEVFCRRVYYYGGEKVDGFEIEPARRLTAATGVIVDGQGNAMGLAIGREIVVSDLEYPQLKATLPTANYYCYPPTFADLLAPTLLALHPQADFGLGGRELQVQTVDVSSTLDAKTFRLLCAEAAPMNDMDAGIKIRDGVWINQSQLGGVELELKPAPAAKTDSKFPAGLSSTQWPRIRNWTTTLPESMSAPSRDDTANQTPQFPGMSLRPRATSNHSRELYYVPVVVGSDGKYVPIRGGGGWNKVVLGRPGG